MKRDGADQMNTAAKTAEYPLERLAFLREAAWLRIGNVLSFIARLGVLNGCGARIKRIRYVYSDPASGALQPVRRAHVKFATACCINFLACQQ